MRIQIKEGPRKVIREVDQARLADDGIIVPKLQKKFLADKDAAETLFQILLTEGHLDLTGLEAVHHVSQTVL